MEDAFHFGREQIFTAEEKEKVVQCCFVFTGPPVPVTGLADWGRYKCVTQLERVALHGQVFLLLADWGRYKCVTQLEQFALHGQASSWTAPTISTASMPSMGEPLEERYAKLQV
eukprot:7779810-Pyramimonas_sp.AAC.1